MTLDNDLITFLGGTLTLMLFAFTLVIFLIVHKKKRYEHLLEKQALENNYHSQLLLSRMEVQEQSFKYFSEEIHDNIGQLLSIVKMQLYNIRNNSKEQQIISKAGECTDLLSKAISDLRNISHTLNSTFVNTAGLVDAVNKDLEYVRSARDMQCTLHRSGDEYSMGNERELLIFRIIQEAITNAIKHAAPAAIDVYLDYTPLALCVTVADNGSGFETDNVASSGIGLSNMYVRTDLLKSKLEVVSEKNVGTRIRLEINR
jgi:signal transduction histidine kinase